MGPTAFLGLLARTLLLCSPALLTVPTVQVLGVRWLTPRLTLTMVGQVAKQGGVPDVRPLHYADAGHLPRAIVSSEDGRFFVHNGFDWVGICDALDSNKQGKRLRGGSSISQQTARNVFLWQTRSWTRKGLEVGYTTLLEALVPKERILELYLNVAETGPMVFGFEAGAQLHFKRSASALSADQAARMTYLLPNPRKRTTSSPNAAKKASWVRRNLAPIPGDDTHDKAVAAWEKRPWWPVCPD